MGKFQANAEEQTQSRMATENAIGELDQKLNQAKTLSIQKEEELKPKLDSQQNEVKVALL